MWKPDHRVAADRSGRAPLAFLAPDLVKAAIDGRLPIAWA
jgi:hypothetical protein